MSDSPTPWRIEEKNGYATVYDAEGQVVPLLTDLELGWTDTDTGNYVDPQGDYAVLEKIVHAVNCHGLMLHSLVSARGFVPLEYRSGINSTIAKAESSPREGGAK